jgi:hypothetical protein
MKPLCCIPFVTLNLSQPLLLFKCALAFKKGLSRTLQERSLDIGRALKKVTLVQSSIEDYRANIEQFKRQCFKRSIKIC